ncbi:hypothetical protein BJ742DRAFT_788693 [Cladochytrium replicatum]|nr:hypothetical protein BJ742DRAFT_788693 [Cladochytrium replicatum]
MDYSYFFQSRNTPTPDDAQSEHSSVGTSSESPYPYTSSESSFSGNVRHSYTCLASRTKSLTSLTPRRAQLAAEMAEWERKKMAIEAERRARDAAFREKLRREDEEVEKVQEMVRAVVEERKRMEERDRMFAEQEKEVKRIRAATARRDRWFMSSVLDSDTPSPAHTLESGSDARSIDGRRRSIGYFDGSSSVSVGSDASDLRSSRLSSCQDLSVSRRMTESELAHTELYNFVLEVDRKRQSRRLEADERRRSAIERMRELLYCEDSFEVFARSSMRSDTSNQDLTSPSKELDSRGARILGFVHEDRSKMFRRRSFISMTAEKYTSDEALEVRSEKHIYSQRQQNNGFSLNAAEEAHRMTGSRAGMSDSKFTEFQDEGPMKISELSDPQLPRSYGASPHKSTDEIQFTTGDIRLEIEDWRSGPRKKAWQSSQHGRYVSFYGHSGFDQTADYEVGNAGTTTARAAQM